MNTFTLGAVAGIATLALAVPVLAQISSAATVGAQARSAQMFARPAPTQQQVLDMAAQDEAFLKNVDASVSIRRSATQVHLTALKAAAAITDETLRHEAVQKANETFRTTMQEAVAANPELRSAMMPFGGRHGFAEGKGGPGMMMGRGLNQTDLAAKLGMTEADLKAALDSGKTIQQIATEKGVTLPAGKGRGGMHGGGMMNRSGTPGASTSSTSSAQ